MTSSKLHYQRKLTAGHLYNDVGGDWLVERGWKSAFEINWPLVDKGWIFVSSRIHEKRPQELIHFVYENLPFMSTRILHY